MVREPPVSGDPVGAAKRARCERAGALRLLGDESSAAAAAGELLQAAEELERSQLAETLGMNSKRGKEMPDWLSEKMAEWLGRHRLQGCATELARIAGA